MGGQRIAIAALGCLLLASIALSYWTVSHALVKLPAADLWQHTTLIEEAATGTIRFNTLLQKHNHLHFIPLPKLIYALDIALFSGNGLLTAAMSAFFTLLCSALFACAIFSSGNTGTGEKWGLTLLAGSWLTCILQWESFVNPANLQWSGLSAGFALIGVGLQRQPLLLATGCGLAIGCGAPWWLLPLAALPVWLPARPLLLAACSTLVAALLWEIANGYLLHATPPLALLAVQVAMPLPVEQISALSSAFYEQPLRFYLAWMGNLLQFIASVCLPPLERWLSPQALASLGSLPLLAIVLLISRPARSPALLFMACAALLTALAAGSVRAQLPGAYTLRFANTGLLFACAIGVLAYPASRQHKSLWWLIALACSGLLATTCLREAADIVKDSNQRRLSQLAYALDILDMRATSELPYAPLMAQSYAEISTRKGVLQAQGIGIYASREHRIYRGELPLPTAVTTCQYEDITFRPVKDDPLARKLNGQAHNPDGTAMDSVLLRDSNGQAIGYGIFQMRGDTLIQQLRQPRRWAGFLHRPVNGEVDIIAYNRRQRCQPFRLTIP